jgi:NADPH:quinone reductase-like Zn-dependent oxidoreductase
MTAIVHDNYGTAPEQVLRVADVATPTIGDDAVLVHVRAASVDRGTWHIMAGLPYPIRLAGFGLRKPKHLNPGRCFAGTIDAVGADVIGFARGDAVYGTGDGSFAQYIGARPDKLAHKPAKLSFAEAATVPISGVTALQAVRDQGQVRAGQHVLIIGASGGVGSFAVQIAKAFGAEVTGVCSRAKLDMVRALGADHVIDYTREDFAVGGARYDVILDVGGNASLSRLRRSLSPKGTLVLVGGETDGRWLGGTDRTLRALAMSPFVTQSLGTFIATENAADLIVLRELIEADRVKPVLDRSYPLDGVPTAVRHLVGGHARGKTVITL